MHQQLARTVRAHAGEIGREVAAFVFEQMAARAVHEEQFVPVLDVAGPFDLRPEPGDQLLLLLLFGALQLVNHSVGAGGDRFVRVRTEAMPIRRTEGRRVNLLFRQRLHERERPIGAFEQLAQHRLAQFARHARVSSHQFGARRGVDGRTERLDDARLHGG